MPKKPDLEVQDDPAAIALPPFPAEQLLSELLAGIPGDRLLCTSLGRAQLAHAAARAGRRRVVCWYLDQYRAALVPAFTDASAIPPQIVCAADLPTDEVDVVALPTSSKGEAELTRDLLQQGHQRLAIGGTLLVSTDNRADRWLADEMHKLFASVRRYDAPQGAAYVAIKTAPLKKEKNFSCEFVFRDGEHLIRAYSRPGVFAHRRIDPGARHLLAAVQLRPGARVIDIGCGSGTASLAVALREPSATVHAVDSNARAIECTTRGAALNDVTNITTELNAFGPYVGSGEYDVALANPPYYASFRIAEHFLLAARESLRPGGMIWVVTKSPNWFADRMSDWYDNVIVYHAKTYYVAQGQRPRH